MSMSCSEVLGELPLHVGGDLESPAREQVARHLESCEGCRAALAGIERARQARLEHFEGVAADLPQASLWPGLRERLATEGLIHAPAGSANAAVSAVRAAGPAPTRGRLLRFLPVAAAAAGIFLLGFIARQQLGGSDPAGDGLSTPGAGAEPTVVEGTLPVADPTPARSDGRLRPVEPRGGTPLQPVDPASEYFDRRVQPFFGETALPFNALQPSRPASFGSASYDAASYGGQAPEERCDGVR